jgi:predicted NAD/FAD-binding protein
MSKIAVIGAGISGLSCAYRLAQAGLDVSLFEAGDYFGGHSHTANVRLDGVEAGVDTGFLVFNERTYPQLIRLFAELGVETAPSDMSFSVRMPLERRTLEWGGASLDTVFAQRRNLASPHFVAMLADIVRFNRQATALATADAAGAASDGQSLGEFLRQGRYSEQFSRWYLLPMAACIWSCPVEHMLAFPAISFMRFCHNHGLLQLTDRPQWHTVRGGSRNYVQKLLAGIPTRHRSTPVRMVSRVQQDGGWSVRVCTDHGVAHFDHVVMATHSDQSLAMFDNASPQERKVLGAIAYQSNRAVLHTDAACLPRSRKTWSAWNYQSDNAGGAARVCVHYLINKLQPLPFESPVIVSLNPIDQPAAGSVLGQYDYAHPVFDAAAVAAQGRLPALQGQRNTWFAGAWTGYGFHEDGLKSGLAVASALIGQLNGQAEHLHAA